MQSLRLTRKQKLFSNTIVSLLHQITSVICGFILPHAILNCYGSGVNGLVNSISQFLGFISMAECGVSSVVQANLYSPLAEKDDKEISIVFSSSEKFFRKIALLLAAYVFVLVFVYPQLVNESFGALYTSSLILILAISSFAQYYFGMSYRILLNADQYSFVVSGIQCIILILNTIISIFLIRIGFSIHSVKLSASLLYLLQPIGMWLFTKRHYHIDRKVQYSGEPIKQKWNGLAQHVAQIIATQTDTIVLTVLSTLENVSIYSVYNLVVSGVVNLFESTKLGVAPLIGDMLAKKENKKLNTFFDSYEWCWHTVTTFIFTLTGFLIVPFVSIYTKGVNDAEYVVPLFGALITIAQGVRMLRTPYHIMVTSAGHYKQTQTSSIIEAALNLSISIIMVAKFGLKTMYTKPQIFHLLIWINRRGYWYFGCYGL